MKAARSRLTLTIAGVLLLGLAGTDTRAQSSTPRLSASQGFTACQGTFALCTVARCTPPPGNSNSTVLSCPCSVQQGWSAGQQACTDVPTAPPAVGMKVPSRYAPITSMAVCLQQPPSWAWCLDMSCTIDKGLKTATCNCVATTSPNWVIVTSSYSPATCPGGTNVSSAALEDILSITAFLESQPQLKPKPITIVGVGGAPQTGGPGNKKP